MHKINKKFLSIIVTVFALFFPLLGICKDSDNEQLARQIKRGEKLYGRCMACHSLEKDKHRAGPSLYLIFGKKSGSTPFFPYSKNMKASDIYWDRAALKKFLHSPRQVIPGNRMAFPGFKNDEDLEAILSFLEENAR